MQPDPKQGLEGGQYQPLDQKQVQKIHTASLRILEQTGVQVDNRHTHHYSHGAQRAHSFTMKDVNVDILITCVLSHDKQFPHFIFMRKRLYLHFVPSITKTHIPLTSVTTTVQMQA